MWPCIYGSLVREKGCVVTAVGHSLHSQCNNSAARQCTVNKSVQERISHLTVNTQVCTVSAHRAISTQLQGDWWIQFIVCASEHRYQVKSMPYNDYN